MSLVDARSANSSFQCQVKTCTEALQRPQRTHGEPPSSAVWSRGQSEGGGKKKMERWQEARFEWKSRACADLASDGSDRR